MNSYELFNVEDILKTHFKDDIEIQNQEVKMITAPGEHYGSFILGIDVGIITKKGSETLNLVAKLIPVCDLLQEAFDVQVTFKKEAFTYMVTIPALLEFLQDSSVSKEGLLDCVPKCYGARYNLEGNDEYVDRNGIILLENLKTLGYETIDRLKGCDLDTSKLVIRNLANFHAVPLALRLLKPEIFEKKVKPGLVTHKGAEQLGATVVGAFHNTIMKVAQICEELSPYLGRIQKLVDYYETHPYTERPEPSEAYGTLTHCDLWTSNFIILKNSDNVVVDVKLLDFQLTNFSSPIRDLVFFLFTSVQNEVLKDYLDDLIKLYYDNFIETLSVFNINLDPYSWDNFNKELNTVAPDEVYHILFILKVVCSERGKVTNTIDKFEIADWTREDLLGEDHKNKLKNTVLALVSKDWL